MLYYRNSEWKEPKLYSRVGWKFHVLWSFLCKILMIKINMNHALSVPVVAYASLSLFVCSFASMSAVFDGRVDLVLLGMISSCFAVMFSAKIIGSLTDNTEECQGES